MLRWILACLWVTLCVLHRILYKAQYFPSSVLQSTELAYLMLIWGSLLKQREAWQFNFCMLSGVLSLAWHLNYTPVQTWRLIMHWSLYNTIPTPLQCCVSSDSIWYRESYCKNSNSSYITQVLVAKKEDFQKSNYGILQVRIRH